MQLAVTVAVGEAVVEAVTVAAYAAMHTFVSISSFSSCRADTTVDCRADGHTSAPSNSCAIAEVVVQKLATRDAQHPPVVSKTGLQTESINMLGVYGHLW